MSSSGRDRPIRSPWPRVAAAVAVVLLLAFGAVAATPDASRLGQGTNDTGTATLAALPMQSRTIHVSTDGDDDGAGSAGAPKRTLRAAVSMSKGGDTIVVHGGVYREELKIEDRPGLELVAVPGADVWLDGSVVVKGWEREGDVWIAGGWTVEFDSSPTYRWGVADHARPGWNFINPEHPLAAHPDQVWLDDDSQVQVGSRDEVQEGTFYVDYGRDELVLGSDPEGRTVTASALTQALRVRSADTVVRNIGIRKYSPSVPHMGAVTIEAPRVTLAGVTVSDSATTGVHVLGDHVHLRDVVVERNGKIGLTATGADGLELVRVTARENNTERFNTSPAAGGAKIGRSTGVSVRDSVFSGNHATGVWFDESVYDVSLVNSRMVDNLQHGASFELVGKAVVAGNVVARNGGNGVKINNSEEVGVWNNTFVDNNRSINIVQDDRDLHPRGSFRDPKLPLTWQTQGITVRNNVLASTGAVPGQENHTRICLLCVEDYSGRWTAAEMDVTALGNVYQRPDTQSPRWIVVWSRRDKDPYVFRSLDGFRRTVRQEGESAEFTGATVLSEELRPLPRLERLHETVAQPLPRGIAELVGRSVDERYVGAWMSGQPMSGPHGETSTEASAERTAR